LSFDKSIFESILLNVIDKLSCHC